MPLRPCLEPGCPNVVRSGRCPDHAAAHARARRLRRLAAGSRIVYEDRRWQKTRRRALERAGHQCQALEHGERCTQRDFLHAHHDYPGGVEQMLADGADPFDVDQIVILCERHHGQLTAYLQAESRRNARFRR